LLSEILKMIMKNNTFVWRLAEKKDVDKIVEIIAGAVKRLAQAGINQWQNGYPNREVVIADIEKGVGRVVCKGDEILIYGAVVYSGEKAYDDLKGGAWLMETHDYATIHRVCVVNNGVGKGYGKIFMTFAEDEVKKTFRSIRIDTHPDNKIMQSMVESLNYSYCGTVMYESLRLAYEKLL
jgi:hypothetical protein